MTPLKYRHENGLNAIEIVRTVNAAGYERFDRKILSIIENGDRTGVALCSDGLKAVKKLFPEYAKALPHAESVRNRDAGRKDKNRFSFRTSDEFAERLRKAVAASGQTIQDYIVTALEGRIKKDASVSAKTEAPWGKTNDTTIIEWIKEDVNG